MSAEPPKLSQAELDAKKNQLTHNESPPKSQQAVLSEVRTERGGEHLKHAEVKSTQALLQEVRLETGEKKGKLAHAATVDKQSLLSEVRRQDSKKNLHEPHIPKASVIEEALSERGIEDPIKIVPVVAAESLPHAKKNLKEAKTVDKTSVLSEVRAEHGGKDHLKHSDHPPKSTQAVMSEVRAANKSGKE